MGLDNYTGDEKIVLGIDLGTTRSAVSYAHLQAGSVPKVRTVTRWPGQEDVAGDSKCHTLVRYKSNKPIAFGADALDAAEDNTHLAKWFKLHLHPQSMRTNANLEVPPLPPGVALKQIYSDFIKYIFDHACEFFQSSSHDGETIFNRLKSTFTIVCATPNGWDIVQQSFLRDAFVMAGVLPQGHDRDRLQFVTEAEASVHFALEHSDGDRWLTVGTNFSVLDAGGSTVDTTMYRCTELTPKLKLEEVTSSECVQAGSVFVDRDAERLLRLKLKGSKFEGDEYINEMLEVFEKKTKRKFDGGPDPSVIAFGRARDNDPTYNISKGRITLTSDEVKATFQNSIFDIVLSCENLIGRSSKFCDAMLLVGGYSESPHLRATLKEKLGSRGIQIVSIEDGVKKAAAEGTTIWYIKQLVRARAVRATFGTNVTRIFNSTDALHQERAAEKFLDIDGSTRVGPLLSTWVLKGQVIRADQHTTFNYHRTFKKFPGKGDLAGFEMQVYACDADEKPTWLYRHSGSSALMPGIRKVCRITGDLSGLAASLQEKKGGDGTTYWQINYNVEISFGTTALCAELHWDEKGVNKTGALTLIPDSVF
ncbi:hypothetical protein EXIGLDRAFT_639271 [Exidia glandulosa HHB12029]|uniref:Actin-like ATPase domain-containing protein n=1 Tax=Exidia glandulosa HHB12029 TaxID=1314781 RepID=A0A165NC64_EXIGL|nr:hypothetical protein EXIGLDRAFT_639271 [Exidia glandulosa HHB12029]